MRHFTPWMRPRQYEQYLLPRKIQLLQGATHVTFGDAVISTLDTCIGAETCEEVRHTVLLRVTSLTETAMDSGPVSGVIDRLVCIF